MYLSLNADNSNLCFSVLGKLLMGKKLEKLEKGIPDVCIYHLAHLNEFWSYEDSQYEQGNSHLELWSTV